jgi:hypothetical protein
MKLIAWPSLLRLHGYIAALGAAACFSVAPPLLWAQDSGGRFAAAATVPQEMPIHMRRGLPGASLQTRIVAPIENLVEVVPSQLPRDGHAAVAGVPATRVRSLMLGTIVAHAR